jgi:hypothetical protein
MTPEERITKIENAIHSLVETQARNETQIEKHNAGIRDLVVVSRSFLESQKEVTVQIRELREAQRTTDEKLNSLIETVDRIIRSRNL